ncbi:MAG: helix-turn-helix transcriptional regulator [Oscillospiraceae bacterium]|nr:helix-turn-helix transcriptional regulator [Oscillospiraceae bacterium]
MELARNLKYFRESKGMTQAELGEAVGLSRSSIAKTEAGWKVPSFEKILLIARILDTTCEELAESKPTENQNFKN